MGSIDQNLRLWNDRYDWSHRGEAWSTWWGGSEAQWFGCIYPRIHAFIPVRSILEIAPGHGRWTQMMKNQCEKMTLVDLSESCIKACRERFRDDTHITFYVNDGKSLEMIPNGTIDFVFSLDSLVHAEKDVLEAYLAQLAYKLTPNGVGFIHHSNLGMYVDPATGKLPYFLRNLHWRAETMTARRFKEYCTISSLECIAQEVINWGIETSFTEPVLNDCFSIFTRPESVWSRPNRIFVNKQFMKEAAHLNKTMELYNVTSFRGISAKPISDR